MRLSHSTASTAGSELVFMLIFIAGPQDTGPADAVPVALIRCSGGAIRYPGSLRHRGGKEERAA